MAEPGKLPRLVDRCTDKPEEEGEKLRFDLKSVAPYTTSLCFNEFQHYPPSKSILARMLHRRQQIISIASVVYIQSVPNSLILAVTAF